MSFAALIRNLSQDLQIVLADVGSAGGLHKRWAPIRDNVTAILFDPFDQSTGSGRDRYFPVALAAGEGRATLNVTKRVSMTPTLLPNVPLLGRFWDKPDHTAIVSTLEIPTDSLDSVMQANQIALDAIKIDVQGGFLRRHLPATGRRFAGSDHVGPCRQRPRSGAQGDPRAAHLRQGRSGRLDLRRGLGPDRAQGPRGAGALLQEPRWQAFRPQGPAQGARLPRAQGVTVEP